MKKSRGITVVLVLGFMGVFTVILGTIVSYALTQSKYGRALVSREQAFHIAEAGLEYYRWFLTRNPSIMLAGSGLVSPYDYSINDPEGATVGSGSVTAEANLQCGAVQWVDLSSRATAENAPGFPRTLEARYMKRSVAEYAFLYNSLVYFGSTNVGNGPYHANNGMRMDGWTNSTVSASVSTFTCDSTMGCNPSQTVPGVWGTSTSTALWLYPVPTVDFAGMALNFSTLKTYAQTSGIMLNPTSVTRAGVQQGNTFSTVGGSDTRGFHLVFNANGTISIYRVTGTTSTYSYNGITADYTYPIIASETLVASNVSIPSTCAIVYSQAKVWIDGTVAGKVTLFAADTGSYNPDIILNGNISYATTDGTSGLTAVAEDSVSVGLVVPNNMSIRGIFVAQAGLYGRDYYYAGYTGGNDSYISRNSLTVNGTIVSNQRGGLWWGSGNGFTSRYNYYDRLLAFSPPPFTPAVTTDYKLVLWREQ